MANKDVRTTTILLIVAVLVIGAYVASEMLEEPAEYLPEETAGMVGEVSFEILPPDQPVGQVGFEITE